MSSIVNQGIDPFSQKVGSFLKGVLPLKTSQTSPSFLKVIFEFLAVFTYLLLERSKSLESKISFLLIVSLIELLFL